ncbi:phage tail protein [Serratia fonticola]|uniref:phage tail protein n=1 Tax=Serratia fonticola TaxID=47917 RepID=UPI00192B2D52|nr:phage tail protein [Serratia fonticola]MBL5864451.1 phage tail protein [Serratia fonticola]
MLKPQLLREAISAANAYLRMNPDSLAIWVNEGKIVSTGQKSLSHEYRYQTNLLVMDYPHSVDTVVLPVQLWIREHQPDLHFNPDLRETGVKFKVDILGNGTADLLITLQLTEAAIVTKKDGELIVTHRTEPPHDPYADVSEWTLASAGEMVKDWIRQQLGGKS